MKQVKSGDKVKVHYHGKLTNGETFDSSTGRAPLEFEVGSGMVIKGFDDGVTGMAVGERKTINIPADEAYGPRNPDMVIEMPKDKNARAKIFDEIKKYYTDMKLGDDETDDNEPYIFLEIR